MIKKDLQKVIREFLSNNRTSLITEVSDETLDLQQKFFNDMLVNKSKIVKRYGKDAEKVMKGKAMNLAKKETEKMEKQKLKELVRKSLMQEADIEVSAEKFMGEKDLAQASMMLDALEDQLKNHDWFHMMSDDHRAYTKGSVQQSKIRGIMKNLEDIGYGDEAKSLYNQYAPSQFTLKETKAKKDYDKDGKIESSEEEYKGVKDKAIKKAMGKEVKEAYGEEVESLALTFKDPNEFERAKQHFESNSDFYPFDINDEFKTFYFQAADQEDADSTEFYLNQELEGETDLQGYYFSTESSPLSEDLDLGHEDNEPHMIKGELYKIGKYAMELYQMVDGFEGKGEVDFPAWWQSKITKACSMIGSAKHYLEFELKEPAIDAMVSVAADEDILDENIGKDEILAGRLYKIKNFVQPAFYQKVRSLINSGDLETAELFISRMEPAAAKNDMEMAKMMGDLEDMDKVAAQRQREKQMANIFAEVNKGYFKKEFGIGKKKSTKEEIEEIAKKVAEGSYPWDKCIADQTPKYGKEGAAKVCGAIKAAYAEGLEEKKLTKAEKAKKEDIVKGMKKSFKGDESAMYAIATAKAKKVAETIVKKLKND